MYVATGAPNVKWGDTDFKWGGRAPLAPPLAMALLIAGSHVVLYCVKTSMNEKETLLPTKRIFWDSCVIQGIFFVV